MRLKLTPENAVSASVLETIDSKMILRLSDLANEMQFSAEEAGYMAEMSLERMVDNGLTNPKNDDPNIYFPPREREILRFICDDVGTRINALIELATTMVATLGVLHDQMKAADAADQPVATSIPVTQLSLADAISRYSFYLERFEQGEYETNEEFAAASKATWEPWYDLLCKWDQPARTFEEALAALKVASDDMKGVDSCEFSAPMVNAALGFFEKSGGA